MDGGGGGGAAALGQGDVARGGGRGRPLGGGHLADDDAHAGRGGVDGPDGRLVRSWIRARSWAGVRPSAGVTSTGGMPASG